MGNFSEDAQSFYSRIALSFFTDFDQQKLDDLVRYSLAKPEPRLEMYDENSNVNAFATISDIANILFNDDYELPPMETPNWQHSTNLSYGNSHESLLETLFEDFVESPPRIETPMDAFLKVPSSQENGLTLKPTMKPWMNNGGRGNDENGISTTNCESYGEHHQYEMAMEAFFEDPSIDENGYTLKSNMEPWMVNNGGGAENGVSDTIYNTTSFVNPMTNPQINLPLHKGNQQLLVNNRSADFGSIINNHYSSGNIGTVVGTIGEESQHIYSKQPSTLYHNYASSPQSMWAHPHSITNGAISSSSYTNSAYGNEKSWSSISPSGVGMSQSDRSGSEYVTRNLSNPPSSSTAQVLTKDVLSKIQRGHISKGSKTQASLDPSILANTEMNTSWWGMEDPAHQGLLEQLLDEAAKRNVDKEGKKR